MLRLDPIHRLCASHTAVVGFQQIIWFKAWVVHVNPFSTAVPIWGQTGLIPSDLSPKREWGPKRVNGFAFLRVIFPSKPWHITGCRGLVYTRIVVAVHFNSRQTGGPQRRPN